MTFKISISDSLVIRAIKLLRKKHASPILMSELTELFEKHYHCRVISDNENDLSIVPFFNSAYIEFDTAAMYNWFILMVEEEV